MRFDILTLFPEMFPCYFGSSILKRAQKNKRVSIYVHNIRDWAHDKHKTTDDAAYGGISGMVMKVEPIYYAVEALKKKKRSGKKRVVLLSAKGSLFTQQKARSLARYDQLILIAGHYKGVDERVAEYIADEELSIGGYVLTGGELPAMIVVDAVSRMAKGVIGDERSKEGESFSTGVLHEHPVYTRPETFQPLSGSKGRRTGRAWHVPKALLSGNHKKIEEWRERHRTYNTEHTT